MKKKVKKNVKKNILFVVISIMILTSVFFIFKYYTEQSIFGDPALTFSENYKNNNINLTYKSIDNISTNSGPESIKNSIIKDTNIINLNIGKTSTGGSFSRLMSFIKTNDYNIIINDQNSFSCSLNYVSSVSEGGAQTNNMDLGNCKLFLYNNDTDTLLYQAQTTTSTTGPGGELKTYPASFTFDIRKNTAGKFILSYLDVVTELNIIENASYELLAQCTIPSHTDIGGIGISNEKTLRISNCVKTTTVPTIANRTYYRFINNCTIISINPQDKLGNDYETEQECINQIPTNKTYYRFFNNSCRTVSLLETDKTSNDYEYSLNCTNKIPTTPNNSTNSTVICKDTLNQCGGDCKPCTETPSSDKLILYIMIAAGFGITLIIIILIAKKIKKRK